MIKDVGIRIIKRCKSGEDRMNIVESKNVTAKAGQVLFNGFAGTFRAHPRPKGGIVKRILQTLALVLICVASAHSLTIMGEYDFEYCSTLVVHSIEHSWGGIPVPHTNSITGHPWWPVGSTNLWICWNDNYGNGHGVNLHVVGASGSGTNEVWTYAYPEEPSGDSEDGSTHAPNDTQNSNNHSK